LFHRKAPTNFGQEANIHMVCNFAASGEPTNALKPERLACY